MALLRPLRGHLLLERTQRRLQLRVGVCHPRHGRLLRLGRRLCRRLVRLGRLLVLLVGPVQRAERRILRGCLLARGLPEPRQFLRVNLVRREPRESRQQQLSHAGVHRRRAHRARRRHALFEPRLLLAAALGGRRVEIDRALAALRVLLLARALA
eukprot:1267270-Prymnesium_polylepis.1